MQFRESKNGYLSNILKSYNIQGYDIVYYCKVNGLKYSNVYYRFWYYIQKNGYNNTDIDSLINDIIGKMLIKQRFNRYRIILNNLVEKDVSYKKIREYCQFLGINYLKIKRLSWKILNLQNLIVLTFFSGNKKDDNGKYITLKRVRELLKYENCDINDYVALFKLWPNNTWNKLDANFSYLYKNIVNNNLKLLNLRVNKYDYQDILSQANLLFMKSCKICSSNKAGQIVNYIKCYITNKIKIYIIKNYAYQILDYEYFERCKKNKFGFTNMNYLVHVCKEPLYYVIFKEQLETIKKAFYSLDSETKQFLNYFIIQDKKRAGFPLKKYVMILKAVYYKLYEGREAIND